MRLPLVVANWKMNKTRAEARLLAQGLALELGELETVEIVLCPPFTALSVVGEAIQGSNLELGAQNMHYEESGAFTGEIAPRFLVELGVSYVILGHSERRQLFGETDELVQRKVRAALKAGFTPIVCVGETGAERDAGQTFDQLRRQFQESIVPAVTEQDLITVAYEPVWAIGTGRTATPEQAGEVHRFLRGLAEEQYGPAWAGNLRILYGGSVTADNINQLMAVSEINGVLVGGASLKSSFSRIAQFRTG